MKIKKNPFSKVSFEKKNNSIVKELSFQAFHPFFFVIESGCVTKILILVSFLILSNIISLSAKVNSEENEISITVSIKSHPESTEGWTGKSASFTVTVTGTPPIKYQWQKKEDDNWENLTRLSQSRTLKISKLRKEDAGEYRCIVSDEASNKVTSESAILKVWESVTITNKLEDQEKWIGEKVTFKIETRGDKKGVRYSWKHNDLVVKESDKDEYTFQITGMDQAGEYSCEVTDGGGSRQQSNEVVLKINETVAIIKHPRDLQVHPGEDAYFEIEVKGKEPITYKWFHNGLEMPGKNSNILTINIASLSDAGKYMCEVENRGGSKRSNEATLSVSGKLRILEQPEDAMSFTGPDRTATFSVSVIGAKPFDYQWQHNGKDIDKENHSELKVNGVSLNYAGMYRCIIRNDSGEVITNEAKLEVRRTVEITRQPQNELNKDQGETARFSISASGYGNITYQWQKRSAKADWSDLEGKTKSTLEIRSLGPEHSGQYRCKAENGGGVVESDFAHLTIEGALKIHDDLRDEYIGWTEKDITLRVRISGSVPIDIQWFKIGQTNPVHIVASDSSSYAKFSINNLNKEQHEGVYYCIINNSANKPCTSKTTNLLIKKSVLIIEHPRDISAKQGNKVRMGIEAEGDGDITYQWLKDGIQKTEYRSKTLLIENVSSSQRGKYQCIVKNEGGSDTSKTAILEVDGTIIIKHPKNGEQWKIGTVKKIEWECHDKSIILVDIWFSENGGKDYHIIKENATNSKGEYQWEVPDIRSSECKIKISSSENEQIDDETDGFFHINTFEIPIINFSNKSKLFSQDQFQVFPNPIKSGMDHSIFFVLDSPIKILEREISIYDALGNRIAVMPGTQLMQENNRCNLGSWNLLSRSYERITNGAYLAVLTITDSSGNKHILTKLIGIYDQPEN